MRQSQIENSGWTFPLGTMHPLFRQRSLGACSAHIMANGRSLKALNQFSQPVHGLVDSHRVLRVAPGYEVTKDAAPHERIQSVLHLALVSLQPKEATAWLKLENMSILVVTHLGHDLKVLHWFHFCNGATACLALRHPLEAPTLMDRRHLCNRFHARKPFMPVIWVGQNFPDLFDWGIDLHFTFEFRHLPFTSLNRV